MISQKRYLEKNAKIIKKELRKIKLGDSELQEMFDYAVMPGNKLRGVLVMLGCEAVGGNSKKVLPAAVAVELLHKFSLVHDDMIDGDLYRRGRDAFYVKYGKERTIFFGDLLIPMAYRYIQKLRKNFDDKTLYKVYVQIDKYLKEMCLGEMNDILFEDVINIEENICTKMVENKTASLFMLSLTLGGLLGNASKTQLRILKEIGRKIGIAFQMQNDLNNILGLEEKIGRPEGSDIKQKKKSMAILHAYKKATHDEKKLLEEIFVKAVPNRRDIREAIRIIKEKSAIKYTQKYIGNLLISARNDILKLNNQKVIDVLNSILEYIVGEEYIYAGSKLHK